MSDVDCSRLVGRPREICEGTSGLPEEKRQWHIRRYRSRGLIPRSDAADDWIPPSERTSPCKHRGVFLHEKACESCGHRGQMRELYDCNLLGNACFMGEGHILGAEKCRLCDHYVKVDLEKPES
jgi:hypothetical protein